MEPTEPLAPDLPMTGMEIRDRILGILVSEPAPALACVRRALGSAAGRRSVAAFCELLGMEYSRRVLDALSAEEWASIDRELRASAGETPVSPTTLAELHRAMLWEKLGWVEERPEVDPFAFLDGLGSDRITRMLQGASPAQIALISADRPPARMSVVLDVLPENRRKQVILEIALQQRLPKESLRAAALGFAEELSKAAEGPMPPLFRTGAVERSPGHRARLERALAELRSSRSHEKRLLEFLREEGKTRMGALFSQAADELDSELKQGEGVRSAAFVLESSGNA